MIGGGVGGGIQSSLNGGNGFQIVLGALMGAQQGYATGTSFGNGFLGASAGGGGPPTQTNYFGLTDGGTGFDMTGVKEFISAAPSKTGSILDKIFGVTLAFGASNVNSTSQNRTIRNAIQNVEDSYFGMSSIGRPIVRALHNAYQEGRVGFGNLPGGRLAQVDSTTLTVTISNSIPLHRIAGRLVHEGTHLVQLEKKSPYTLSSERKAFDNAFSFEKDMGIAGAYNLTDSQLRQNYWYLR